VPRPERVCLGQPIPDADFSGSVDPRTLYRAAGNWRLRAIDGGDAPDPYGVGQQVEHAELRPEQLGADARRRVCAAEHVRRDPRQLEELDCSHCHRRPHRHTRDPSACYVQHLFMVRA
jgi:hypothetical protein